MLEFLFGKVAGLKASCFRVNTAKFLRTPFSKNICQRLLLNNQSQSKLSDLNKRFKLRLVWYLWFPFFIILRLLCLSRQSLILVQSWNLHGVMVFELFLSKQQQISAKESGLQSHLTLIYSIIVVQWF